MIGPVRRPRATPAGGSALRHDHFQIAYVTNDIARARAIFSERMDIGEFRQLAGQMPKGGQIHVELAWVGGMMLELVTATGPGADVFENHLPPGSDFVVKHHHLGYMVYDQAEWDGLEAEAERAGGRYIPGNNNPGFLRSCFIEMPLMGHFLEYIFPEPAGLEFFENVPGN